MKFKINLKPYPGAPYFTVSEHKRAFDKKHQKPKENVKISERLLRELFSVPADFIMSIHILALKEEVLNYFKTVIIRDDPETGKVRDGEQQSHEQTSLIDLSFSFPQSIEDLSNFDAVLIDTNASLGIPAGFFILFFKDKISSDFIKKQNEEFAEDWFVMVKVFEDLQIKGKELLIREANYKAAVLYLLIENSKYLEAMPGNMPKSKSMISAHCDLDFIVIAEKLGYELAVSKINEKTMVTIANYPTHSKEMIEMFSDRISVL